MKAGRWLLHLLAACAMLAGVAACSDHVTVTQLEPQSYRMLGEGGDPLVILIGVTWTKDGYCPGQFRVEGTETTTEVRVGYVTSREHSRGACAGVGTVNSTAWADLHLTSPLGDRAVIRDSDGARLEESVGAP